MKIELIAIGDELLAGRIANNNSVFISRELLKSGYSVARHTVLPDHKDELFKGLNEAVQRSDLVIATGGLGPTVDDVTRQVAASLYNQELRFDPNLASALKERFGTNVSIEDQATIPSQALIIENTLGTASGLIFEPSHHNGKKSALILLPGVPAEMEKMVCDAVIPYVTKRFAKEAPKETKNFYFYDLPEGTIAPLLNIISEKYPEINIASYPSFATVAVHLSMPASIKSFSILDQAGKLLEENFGDYLYETHSGRLSEAIKNLFIKKGWTLATAESITGGNIAAYLTLEPGASKFFQGGIISYANSLKIDLLNVNHETLNHYGVVSEQVAQEMALGLQHACPCDFAVAITGIAGPDGGSEAKPVGTICAAIAYQKQIIAAWTFHRKGTRQMIINDATNILLGKLLIVGKHIC